ncbi:hypothetical protein PHISCL_10911, partial [Aspergillus sclerotialis]
MERIERTATNVLGADEIAVWALGADSVNARGELRALLSGDATPPLCQGPGEKEKEKEKERVQRAFERGRNESEIK